MSLAYFPFYPADYEAKTAHLSLEEDGAYNRLLRLCWVTPGCSIPDDRAWIVRRLRVTEETYDRVVAVVIEEFFNRRRGRLYQAKLTKIFEETSAAHNRRVKAGEKGGRPRKSLKDKDDIKSNAKPMLKQPEPEPEPYKKEREPNGSLAIADDVAAALIAYNSQAEASGWPVVQKLTQARWSKLRGRLNDCGGLDGWRGALEKASASDFLCGRTDGNNPFRCSFDFLMQQSSFTKLMEGNYDNRANPRKSQPSNGRENRSDPALEQISRLLGLDETFGAGRA